MTQMHWLMLAIAILAAVGGFLAGRLTAPREKQYQETRAELDRIQRERDDLRASVEDHFQSTAALFGNLSRDYRALYLHFAEGARSLGLGEEPARKLIEEARAPAAGEEQASRESAASEILDPQPTDAPQADTTETEDTAAAPSEATTASGEERPPGAGEAETDEATTRGDGATEGAFRGGDHEASPEDSDKEKSSPEEPEADAETAPRREGAR